VADVEWEWGKGGGREEGAEEVDKEAVGVDDDDNDDEREAREGGGRTNEVEGIGRILGEADRTGDAGFESPGLNTPEIILTAFFCRIWGG